MREGCGVTEPPNPLGMEQPGDFEPPEEPGPPAHAADLEHGEEHLAPPPDLYEWTPERAAAVLRAGGFLLHVADGLSRVKPPEHEHDPRADCGCDACQLWRLTERDAIDAGAPLARILNRYEPARRLAGVVDEVEFGSAMLAYAKRNLTTRARLLDHKRAVEERPAGHYEGAEYSEEQETRKAAAEGHVIIPGEGELGAPGSGFMPNPPPPPEPE